VTVRLGTMAEPIPITTFDVSCAVKSQTCREKWIQPASVNSARGRMDSA
jgi:hypothetical protein